MLGANHFVPCQTALLAGHLAHLTPKTYRQAVPPKTASNLPIPTQCQPNGSIQQKQNTARCSSTEYTNGKGVLLIRSHPAWMLAISMMWRWILVWMMSLIWSDLTAWIRRCCIRSNTTFRLQTPLKQTQSSSQPAPHHRQTPNTPYHLPPYQASQWHLHNLGGFALMPIGGDGRLDKSTLRHTPKPLLMNASQIVQGYRSFACWLAQMTALLGKITHKHPTW